MRTDHPSSVEAAEYAPVNPPVGAPTPPPDPLADASCLQCGYSLRGLTEHRCPECGTPFDPQLMASSYLPEWPRLVAWYLAAETIARVLQMASRTAYAMSYSSLASGLTQRPTDIGWLFETLVAICLAPIAILGLRRHIDWGRKTAIGLFLLQALPSLPVLVWMSIFLYFRSASGAAWSPGNLFSFAEAVGFMAPTAIPAAILACTLWTGLRPYSLRRSMLRPVLMLPFTLFHPRRDWLLVLVAILAASALADIGILGSLTIYFLELFLDRSAFGGPDSWWPMCLSLGSTTVAIAVQCGWVAWVAVRVWREPARAARRLKTLTFVTAGIWIAVQVRWLIMDLPRYASVPTRSSVPLIVGALVHVIAAITVPLALYLYASRVLPPEAMARVAKPPIDPPPSGAQPAGVADDG